MIPSLSLQPLIITRFLRFGAAAARASVRRWPVALTACLVVGASATAGCKKPLESTADAGKDESLKRGDRVVVEVAAAQFIEGQVLDVVGNELQVQTSQSEETVVVAVPDAYGLPGRRGAYASGDLVVCSPEPEQWHPCRVISVAASGVVAATGDGQQHRVEPSRVLVPSPVTKLNLERYFERAEQRAQFAAHVRAAGLPRPPPGWHPAPREPVLGYRQQGWYAATIEEIEDDALHLRWTADGRVTMLSYRYVIPEPPYVPGVVRKQLALARPPGGLGAWQPVRVVSVTGDGVVVVDVDGERRSLAQRDLVPLQSSDDRGE